MKQKIFGYNRKKCLYFTATLAHEELFTDAVVYAFNHDTIIARTEKGLASAMKEAHVKMIDGTIKYKRDIKFGKEVIAFVKAHPDAGKDYSFLKESEDCDDSDENNEDTADSHDALDEPKDDNSED